MATNNSAKPPMACDMIAAVRLNTEDLNKELKQMNEGIKTLVKKDVNDQFDEEYEKMNDWENVNAIEIILDELDEFNKEYKCPILSLKIKRTQEKLAKNKVNIGVFGLIKSGKSTILNAVTRSELFPTATPPETSVVIGVSHDRSIHQGICLNDRGICTQKENCPKLTKREHRGSIIGTSKIVAELERLNKDVRENRTEIIPHHILACVPSLSNATGDLEFVIEDTPGLEEWNDDIMEYSMNALHLSSAYIYVLDYNRLGNCTDIKELNILQSKDPEIFKDGRLLILANQFDRSFEPKVTSSASKEVFSLERVVTEVGRHLSEPISHQYIIPCVGLWAWYVRVKEGDVYDDDIELWSKKYQRASDTKSAMNPRDLIENVSGILSIEKWISTLASNGKKLFMTGLISDTKHCLENCIKTCHKSYSISETTLNEKEIELESMINAMELICEKLRFIQHQTMPDSEVEKNLQDAYQSDIIKPCKFIIETAQQHLETFKDNCLKNCKNPGTHICPLCHGEPFCAEFFEEDDFLGVEIGDKKDDIEDDDSLTGDEEKPRGYILLHFNHDFNNFITSLEKELNRYLETVTFQETQASIPLEGFGVVKTELCMLADKFLNITTDGSTKCTLSDSEYSLPKYQDCLGKKPLNLLQLKEMTTIRELKLTWWTRLKNWVKIKLVHIKSSKWNHELTEADIESVMSHILQKNNCLTECEQYLPVNIKPLIVKCYFDAYCSHVLNTLKEFESNILPLLWKRSKEIQEHVSALQNKHVTIRNKLHCLLAHQKHLIEEKLKYNLDMEEFTNRNR